MMKQYRIEKAKITFMASSTNQGASIVVSIHHTNFINYHTRPYPSEAERDLAFQRIDSTHANEHLTAALILHQRTLII
ncbi:MAG: hypothetical protein AAF599_11565 [Bacteroidota bacterium]